LKIHKLVEHYIDPLNPRYIDMKLVEIS